MSIIDIYQDATLYDRIVRPGPCEAFYREVARRAGGPVLELACGTGRLTVPLARDRHDVLGLDASPAMLRAARAKADAQGVAITLVRADLRSFDLGRKFAAIILSCNSMAHLTTSVDLEACLGCVRRHLAPRGVFAFDVVNPDLHLLAQHPGDGTPPGRNPDPSSPITVVEVASYDPVRQVRTAEWLISGPDASTLALAPMKLRIFFPQELTWLLAANGLYLSERYGDFSGKQLTRESSNQICLAMPAPPAGSCGLRLATPRS